MISMKLLNKMFLFKVEKVNNNELNFESKFKHKNKNDDIFKIFSRYRFEPRNTPFETE